MQRPRLCSHRDISRKTVYRKPFPILLPSAVSLDVWGFWYILNLAGVAIRDGEKKLLEERSVG